MEKEKIESMMVEFVEGTLSKTDRAIMELQIQNDPAVALLLNQTRAVLAAINRATELSPSPSMKSKFEKELQKAIRQEKRSFKIVPINPTFMYRMAAGFALVLSAGAVIFWISRNMEQERELAILKIELMKTKTMMMALLENQSSAGQRIQGVNVAYEIEAADDEILNALVERMNQDANINVRLAAVEALSQFHQQKQVRDALINSLGTQTDPSVQIALIRLLVEIKEIQTLKELQRLSTDENVLPAVKDEAHAGIMKLS